MKILPVSAVKVQNVSIGSSKFVLLPSFTSDSFRPGGILDDRLNEISENIKTEIDPFKEKYNELFIQAAHIGYDSQEKLKLILDYEQKLMEKRFYAEQDNEVFKKFEKELSEYEQYNRNIKTFESRSQLILKNDLYSTPEIQHALQNGKGKIYQNSEEFKKLEPLYDKYQSSKKKMDSDLENNKPQNLPDFFSGIKSLDEQNKTAIYMLIVSGYSDMADIYKYSNELIKDCKDAKKPMYRLVKQAENLNSKIYNFIEDIPNIEKAMPEISKFLEKNKNYKTDNLSEKEIRGVYEELLKKSDEIIEESAETLREYRRNNPVKINKAIQAETLKAQTEVINEIDKLMAEEREKFYSNINMSNEIM